MSRHMHCSVSQSDSYSVPAEGTHDRGAGHGKCSAMACGAARHGAQQGGTQVAAQITRSAACSTINDSCRLQEAHPGLINRRKVLCLLGFLVAGANRLHS